MAQPPATLPADFSQWDAAKGPPPSLPADFSKWDAPAQAAPQPSFMDQIGDRIKQNAYLIPDALDALKRQIKGQPPTQRDLELKQMSDSIRHMAGGDEASATGKILRAATLVPQMAVDTVKGWIERPATAVGDIITAKLGSAMAAPEAQAAAPAPAPVEAALTPMQQWWKARGGTLVSERPNGPIQALAPRPSIVPPPTYAQTGEVAPTPQTPTSVEPPTAPSPTNPPPNTSPKAVESLLNDSLGGKPLQKNVSLRDQFSGVKPTPKADVLPPGHEPVSSSAIKSFKYDPETRELETVTTSGSHYIHGDVSPEQAEAFSSADSKGKAWNQIRQNSPLVAKVIGGKRIPVSGGGGRMVTPEDVAPERPDPSDLTPQLQKSLEMLTRRRAIQNQ